MKIKARMALIGFMVLGISFLHYDTGISRHHYHIFYRELYFVPVVLAGSWFGLRGALLISLSVTTFFLPYTLMTWEAFSTDDFTKVIVLLLYNTVGVILGVLKDRERAGHRRLLEAEGLASMGQALAAVAHDLKTPLIAIGGYTRLVQKKLGRDDSSYEKLGVVINETARLEAMVKDMLDFSRPLRIERSKVDLNEIVKESIAIVEETTKIKDVKVETRLSNGLPAVSIDAPRMKQVFLNLLLNAIEASPEREIVTVKTCLEDSHIRIDVADNGCGIPPAETDKIFTPFFTMKKGGTGLGLPIAKKIVHAHKGSLEVFDGARKGTTFEVSIPIPKKMSIPGQNLSKM